MSRVFITGATGYIGSHLVESLLADGRQVSCLLRESSRQLTLPSQRLSNLEWVIGDLSDVRQLRQWLRDCDVVYHLAGCTSARFRSELYHTNVDGSAALARACAEQPHPPRLILVSSLAAAGTSIAGRMRFEHDASRPVSEYGRSKRAGELAAIQWADRVPISVVRPGIIFGERNREMLPMFQSIAQFRLHAVPGYQVRRLALLHHEDLIELLRRVERQGCTVHRESNPDGRGFYVAADPQFLTYPQLGRMIARAVGTGTALILPIAEPLAWLAAAGNQCLNFFRGRSDSFNLDKMREAFAGDWIGSTLRSETELGFHPAASLQSRFNQTARWYQEHGWI